MHSKKGDKRFSIEKLIVRNLKGICNYKNRVTRVFTKEIIPNYPGYKFDIFLCYDTDVFEFSQNPPVDWSAVEKSLKDGGAENIYHIKARKSIEDWLLNDVEGICRHLRLQSPKKINGSNGLKKIENLFKRVNKIYIKGESAKGLIDSLNIQKVMCTNCFQIKHLCKLLGVECK